MPRMRDLFDDERRLYAGDTVLGFNKTRYGKKKPVESVEICRVTDTEITVSITATYRASDGRLTSQPPEFISLPTKDGGTLFLDD